jgi:hypothetical protein
VALRYIGVGIAAGGLLGAALVGVPSAPAAATIELGTGVCFSADLGPGNLPGVGSLALVNLTPVDASAPGYGVLASSTADVPLASNVNFAPGTVDPNVAAAELNAYGEVCFVAGPTADVELAADPLFLLQPGSFASNGPHRVVDTRAGLGGGRLAPAERRCFPVAGAPGDVAALNLTPVLAAGPGYGRLVSSDDTTTVATSSVNFAPGTVDPNVALARIGSDGRLCYVNSDHSAVDLVADELFTMIGGTASAMVPTRVADTRAGLAGTTLAAGEQRCFSVDGDADELAVLNVTPVNAAAAGYGALTRSLASGVDPTTVGSINPTGSEVNFSPGTVDPNLAAEVIGTDGQVCFQNSHHGSVDLVADHVATIASQSWRPPGAASTPGSIP